MVLVSVVRVGRLGCVAGLVDLPGQRRDRWGGRGGHSMPRAGVCEGQRRGDHVSHEASMTHVKVDIDGAPHSLFVMDAAEQVAAVRHMAGLTGLAFRRERGTSPLLGGLLKEFSIESLLVRLEVVAGGTKRRRLILLAGDKPAVGGFLCDGSTGWGSAYLVLADVTGGAAEAVRA